jgi:hypothetical protein
MIEAGEGDSTRTHILKNRWNENAWQEPVFSHRRKAAWTPRLHGSLLRRGRLPMLDVEGLDRRLPLQPLLTGERAPQTRPAAM